MENTNNNTKIYVTTLSPIKGKVRYFSFPTYLLMENIVHVWNHRGIRVLLGKSSMVICD